MKRDIFWAKKVLNDHKKDGLFWIEFCESGQWWLEGKTEASEDSGNFTEVSLYEDEAVVLAQKLLDKCDPPTILPKETVDPKGFTMEGELWLKGDFGMYWYLEKDGQDQCIESKFEALQGKQVRITVEVIE